MKPTTVAKRRQRILDAAAKLYAELDYHAIHMDAIAAAADVAKPTLYRYFETKDALFFAALEQSLGQLAGEIERLCRQPRSAEARLRQAIGLIFERIGRLTPALRAIEGQGIDSKERRRQTLREGFRKLRQEIGLLLDEGTDRGEFKTLDTEAAALAIVGAIRMTAMAGSSKRKGAELVADLVLRGLALEEDVPDRHAAIPAAVTIGAAS